jgi:hypothetical protein
MERRSQSGFTGNTLREPVRSFQEAAAGVGIAAVRDDARAVVRQYYPGDYREPSLPAEAAKLAGAAEERLTIANLASLWLNYYGSFEAGSQVSFAGVSQQPAGFFRDKYVFVGSKPNPGYPLDEIDEFRTPHNRWGGDLYPGVAIAATAFLNLVRDESLTRWGKAGELLLIVLTGVALGFGLTLFRPLPALAVGAVAVVVVVALAAFHFFQHRIWIPWTVVGLVQFPCAFTWSVLAYAQRTAREKKSLEETLSRARTETGAAPAAAPTKTKQVSAEPVISDHAMLRCVGRGAYGEVWLARDVLGNFHAVKVVRRSRFSGDRPYEREFKGIQNYTPISRLHPGWVHVLHVGRNDAEGYFYYVMEVGDDQTDGERIVPDTYTPRNLAVELQHRGRFPLPECLELGVTLSGALEHLHQRGLIHRDIKPSNIIFVRGAPKFADIGLVTEIRGTGKEVSYLGTEGYIAPEGPGTPAADVYSLGKLLYDIAMGRDRREFPEPATTLAEQADDPHWSQFNDILLKACALEASQRYPSAAALQVDLLKLQERMSGAG